MWRVLLVAGWCLALVAAVSDVTITSISPLQGSLIGGTRLNITGSGFSMDTSSSLNYVYVGSYPCNVINHLTTGTMVVCETTAAAGPASLKVSVSVAGVGGATICCFSYSREHTPTTQALMPSAGPPGSLLSIYGFSSGTTDWDCLSNPASDSDTSKCVGSVLLADYICKVQPEGVGAVYAKLWQPRLDTWSYQLNCSLPAPSGSGAVQASPQVGLGIGGSYNVTTFWGGSLKGSKSQPRRGSYRTGANGTPYHYQIYPTVSSVSPSAGSLAGGQPVTITGTGFPSSALPSNSTLAVQLGGVPCDVATSNFTTIVCTTRPRAADYVGPQAMNGLYPGLRGVAFEFLPTASGADMTLWKVAAGALPAYTASNAGYSSQVLQDVWEGPDYTVSYYCDRTAAFYTAPVTGAYTFLLDADDYAQLNATYYNGSATVTTTLATLTSYIAPDVWPTAQGSPGVSGPLQLTEGQRVLLSAAHCNGGWYGTVQVGVLVPSATPRFNSVGSKQQLTLSNTNWPRSVAFRYLWPPGGDTVRTITLSGSAAALLHPLLALNLTINGALLPLLPANVTGDAFAAAVATALNIGNPASGAFPTVGALRRVSPDGTSVSFQLAFNTSRVPGVVLNLAVAASVAALPATPAVGPDCAATCSFAAPVLQPAANGSGIWEFAVRTARRYNQSTCGTASPVPPDLSGVTTLVTSDTVAGGEPGGFWRVSSATDASMVVDVPWNATATFVRAAVNSLPAPQRYTVAGTTMTRVRVGAKVGFVWNVTYQNTQRDKVMDFAAQLAYGAPALASMDVTVQPASLPLVGSYSLAVGNYCDSVVFNVSDSADVIEAKLNQLPGVNAAEASCTGDLFSGQTCTITFGTLGSSGADPGLLVVTNSSISGTAPGLTLTSLRNASNSLLYGPIPVEMLQLPVSYPNAINVRVNGVPAACAAGSTCAYAHDAALTPTVTAVDPAGAINPSTQQTLTITGTLFSTTPSDNTVSLGKASCAVTSATATSLICTLAPRTPSGALPLRVTVAGKGLASGNFTIPIRNLVVSGASPGRLATASAGSVAPSRRLLAAAAATAVSPLCYSLVNVTGRGFNAGNCSAHQVTLGGIGCAVVNCTSDSLLAMFPGGAANSTASVRVDLLNPDDGSIIESKDSPAPLPISSAAPAITGLLSAADLAGTSGNISLAVTGLNTSDAPSWRITLLPAFATNFSAPGAAAAVSAAYGSSRVACNNPGTINATAVNCTVRNVPPGHYFVSLAVEPNIEVLLTNASGGAAITSRLGIAGVERANGSIGGGTLLTITGYGFATDNATANVVLISVPVSSTFINGIILCDVEAVVSSGQLTCRTRGHLAADASADDPDARARMPLATAPGNVQVVLCPSAGLTSDVLKYYCWSDPRPRATCAANSSACRFSYIWAATPNILSPPGPASGSQGAVITVTGQAFDNVTAMWLVPVDATLGGRVACPLSAAASASQKATSASCTVPAMAPGTYRVQLQTGTGELSVDSSTGGAVFAYVSEIVAVSGFVGSSAGGGLLTLTAAGAGFNSTVPSANQVMVGVSSCTVVPPVTPTSLTCRVPPSSGLVLAEYWTMPTGYNKLPAAADIASWSSPDGVALEPGINFVWASGMPSVLSVTNYWVGKFTFSLLAPVDGTYWFQIKVDDSARLLVDVDGSGTLVEVLSCPFGTCKSTAGIALAKGYRAAVVHYVEYEGYASLSLQWDAGASTNASVSGAMVNIPLTSYYIWPPGTRVPLSVRVNGAPARLNCAAASTTFPPATTQALDPAEPRTLTLAAGSCGYVYSSYATPMLSSVSILAGTTTPATVGALSTTVNGADVPTQLQLSGTGLQTANGAADYTISIGGSSCGSVALSAGGTSLSCTVPALPAGRQPLQVSVAGQGFAQLPPGPALVNASTLNITCSARITSLNPASGSFYGGTTVTVSGYGFAAPLAADSAAGMAVAVINQAAALTPTHAAVVLSATATQAAVYIRPLQGANYTSASSTAKLDLQLLITDATGTTTATTTTSFTLDSARTPKITNVTSALANANDPSAGLVLNVSWTEGVGIGAASSSAGLASNAVVRLQGGPNALPLNCTSPTVLSSSLTGTGASTFYKEILTCNLAAQLPAANYTAWLCHEPSGCGFMPAALSVPLTVTALSPSTGSAGGGRIVTITGSGFASNASQVLVRLGNAPCRVTTAASGSVTCITGAAAPSMAAAAASTVAELAIMPSVGASEQVISGLTFTYDASLTPSITSVRPWRGSTEGGTALTITGSFPYPSTPAPTVQLGPYNCTSVTLVSATTITCTSPNPGVPKPLGLLPVTVIFSDRGSSLPTAASPITYEYVDLWSRRTTWGGGDPPIEGDSVLVPAGTTVLLDVSPPPLYALVVEGNLKFDDAADNLELQAHYILVKGGNLSIGSDAAPFPGRAAITLLGPYDSRELPLYGAKVLAVRDGNVNLFGLPKTPSWTTLNATADVGANTITVNGPVNWVAGDRIVIASSSFYSTEVDEVDISAVSGPNASGNTVLTLAKPLAFTHLGELVAVAGDPRGQVVDMRAEVAVLTRNVQVRGDPSSDVQMFGSAVMVSTPNQKGRARAILRMRDVEVSRCGQAFRFARYCIHFHMHQDAAFSSYLVNNAIHNSFQRALTIHGTHRVNVTNNVAYDVMGHTYFFEDGIETGSVLQGNLGLVTRVTNALLNTDTTPATYWVTHPNNTLIGNRAAGSEGYGFWYRFQPNPEGPSYTPTVCPQYAPMGRFLNNLAHSNMFYGLRVFPIYQPRVSQCDGSSTQIAGVFEGMTSYKNGMKGIIATQLGILQFVNVSVADNGAGPLAHIVNGKDNGGDIELTWVVDGRNRLDTPITAMAGVQNALIISRTSVGQRGTAGQWPSGRAIRGITTQSALQGEWRHSAPMSIINATFVDWAGGQFYALETCAKCKVDQGGATTATANLTFIQSGKPAITRFSWPHQGMYLDTDGSLINAVTIDPAMVPAWPLGAGITVHSTIGTNLLEPSKCTYSTGTAQQGLVNAAICHPAQIFSRVMLNNHAPPRIQFLDLLVTDVVTNGTSRVTFSKYNDNGYQFTLPTKRRYWLHWDNPDFQLDPTQFTLHKISVLNATDGWLWLDARDVQVETSIVINGVKNLPFNETLLASPTTATPPLKHGQALYNKNLTATQGWWYGNSTFNTTTAHVFISGTSDGWLTYGVRPCPDSGCDTLPPSTGFSNRTEGVLLWSNASTWANYSAVTGVTGKPTAGQNVTIPYGWTLLIDEDTAPLNRLIIEGNVTFAAWPGANVTLTVTYVIVQNKGLLWAGSPEAPHPASATATIALAGNRDTLQIALTNEVNLGSKCLSVVRGGRLSLHGASLQRWSRLSKPAAAGSNTITVAGAALGWSAGQALLVTSTSYNTNQAEFAGITNVVAGGDGTTTVTLNRSLTYDHGAKLLSYPGSPYVLDMRAEVALLDSNIAIVPADGAAQYLSGGQKFGPRVLVADNATAAISHARMHYCGQAGLVRACIQFQGLKSGLMPTGSYVNHSVTLWGHEAAVRITGTKAVASPANNPVVSLNGNVFSESFDESLVVVDSAGNSLTNNLGLGVIKDMAGKSSFDARLPAVFELTSGGNSVQGNVVAGSERLGFALAGDACKGPAAFLNNSAHGCLASIVLYANADGASCTALRNFTSYLSWDFGVITMGGISTPVEMTDLLIADPKHTGVLILKKGGMTDPSNVTWIGGLLVGRSGADISTMCAKRSGATLTGADPGCHPKLSRQSYQQSSPFGRTTGLETATFAIDFTPGPEPKPWDSVHGYSTIPGSMYVSSVTFANFDGPASNVYAVSNHMAPDAFHPHFFSKVNKVSVPDNALFSFTGPDPGWRNEADCGNATFKQPDGSLLLLNCAGPRHIYIRDVDGSLTGSVTTLLGTFDAARSATANPQFDQGSGVIPGPCAYSSIFKAYSCSVGKGPATVTLANWQAPVPLPAAGVFGDPQYFVIESRDADTETRNFGPVMLETGGITDLAIVGMDQGWCLGYTCQKRLSNFYMTAAMGHTHRVNFTGSPARMMRVWLPHADPASEAVFIFNMLHLPNTRYVWTPKRLRVTPLPAPPTIGDGSDHADYYWDPNTTYLTVKMKGGQSLEMRTENSVAVTQKLNVDMNSFYDIQSRFLTNLAFALGIDLARLKVVSIRPGSTIVNYVIGEDPAIASKPLPEPTYSSAGNVDPAAKAQLRAMPADQQASFLAAYNTAPAASPTAPLAPSPPPPPAATAAAVSPASLASAELVGLLDVLAAILSNGTMEQNVTGGIKTLDMGVALQLIAPPLTASGVPPATAVALGSNTTLNMDQLLKLGAPASPSPAAPPSSGSGSRTGDDGSSKLKAVAIAVPVTVGCAVLAVAALFSIRWAAAKRNATIDSTPLESPRTAAKAYKMRVGGRKSTKQLRTMLSLGALEREGEAEGFNEIPGFHSGSEAAAPVTGRSGVTTRSRSGKASSAGWLFGDKQGHADSAAGGGAASGSGHVQPSAPPLPEGQQQQLGIHSLQDIFAKAAAAAPRWGGERLPSLQLPPQTAAPPAGAGELLSPGASPPSEHTKLPGMPMSRATSRRRRSGN